MADAHPQAPVSDATLDRLLGILASAFHAEDGELTATTTAEDLEDWDSLRTIHLATALEAEFGIAFTPDEIAELQSVPVIVETLAAKGIT